MLTPFVFTWMLGLRMAVEAPVQQAIQASTTAAGMASDLASRYAGMQEDLERTFNAATAAHHASDYARTESLQQAHVARHNLEAATAAINQVRHENATLYDPNGSSGCADGAFATSGEKALVNGGRTSYNVNVSK
jgi:hypothetical protein